MMKQSIIRVPLVFQQGIISSHEEGCQSQSRSVRWFYCIPPEEIAPLFPTGPWPIHVGQERIAQLRLAGLSCSQGIHSAIHPRSHDVFEQKLPHTCGVWPVNCIQGVGGIKDAVVLYDGFALYMGILTLPRDRRLSQVRDGNSKSAK